MNEPRWIDRRVLLLLHSESIAVHGGLPGLRDEGLLDSALARPRNLFTYDPEANVAQLAAAYGFGLIRNHPFIDGNKRIAFIASALFLRINKYRLVAERLDEIRTMSDLAASHLNEDQFAAWIRIHALSQP